MGIFSHISKFCFKSCLVFSLRVDFVVRQMRTGGNVITSSCGLLMQGNLFSLKDHPQQVLIPSDCDFFPNQAGRNRIIVILKMDMTILSNHPHSPVEKAKIILRQWLGFIFFLHLKYLFWYSFGSP